MQQQFKWSLLFCALTALSCGGCAKQGVVKQDQMVPPVLAATSGQPSHSGAAAAEKPDARNEGLSASTISESLADRQVKQEAATRVAQESALKKADLEKVYFNFDSYTLSSEARAALTKNAEILKLKGGSKIRIEGNCDELGSDDYNLALGERRAKAALNYLLNLGVIADRLSTISYGKEKPAEKGNSEAARAKNRRDEFVITSN